MTEEKALDEILAALKWLEHEIEVCTYCDDDGSIKDIRKQEVLIRKLAREAGYKLPEAA